MMINLSQALPFSLPTHAICRDPRALPREMPAQGCTDNTPLALFHKLPSACQDPRAARCELLGNDCRDPQAPIAVFDSGGGGISVLRALRHVLPQEHFLYFGDSANAPYGTRTPEEIQALVLTHAAKLMTRAKALVLACNTATAVAVGALRRTFPTTPIIGMEPALAPALSAVPAPRVLVLATDATCHAPRFTALLERLSAQHSAATVTTVAAGGLVGLVEAGLEGSPEALAYLERILPPHPRRFDAAVLGCTHFAFAHKALRAALGDIPLFDGAAGTARETARRLAAAHLLTPAPQDTHGSVVLTSSSPAALALYRRLLTAPLPFDY